jgi:hypothetical protein
VSSAYSGAGSACTLPRKALEEAGHTGFKYQQWTLTPPRDMGTMVEGKIEAGVCRKGLNLIMMPNRHNVEIAAVYGETGEYLSLGSSQRENLLTI